MPYITEDRRKLLEDGDLELVDLNAGDLNYLVTVMFDEWFSAVGLNYNNINSAVGVLECAKLELYRRIAAPYENAKMAANGDVYECNLNTI